LTPLSTYWSHSNALTLPTWFRPVRIADPMATTIRPTSSAMAMREPQGTSRWTGRSSDDWRWILSTTADTSTATSAR